MFQLVVLVAILSVALAFIPSFKATNVNVQTNGETSLKMVKKKRFFNMILITLYDYIYRLLNYHHYHMLILHLNHILVNKL